jgi:hypothetical protein
MGIQVAMEQSALSAGEFKVMVNQGAQHTLAALADFCDQDAMPQLVILEICRRHLMTVIEHGLAEDPIALAKFRTDLELQLNCLKSTVAS